MKVESNSDLQSNMLLKEYNDYIFKFDQMMVFILIVWHFSIEWQLNVKLLIWADKERI